MLTADLISNLKKPLVLFTLGWCAVLLMPWLPFLTNIITFINPWRVETASSLLLLSSICYLTYRFWNDPPAISISSREIYFIVLPVLLFILWSAISMIWAPSPKTALYHTLVWTVYIIFYLLARQFITQPNGYRLMIGGLTACFLLIGVPAILEYCSLQYFGGATRLGMRFSKYGEQIVTFFPLLMVGILRFNGKKFLLGLLAISTLWLFVFATLSRTSLLLFAGEMIVLLAVIFIFKHFRKYRFRAAKIAFAMILVLIPSHLASFLSAEPNIPIVKRLNDAKGISYSGDFRKLVFTVSNEMFVAHPFNGIGAGNFGQQFNNYRIDYALANPSDPNLMTAENEIAERSHNEYAQILAELGIIGFVLFAGLLFGIGLMGFEITKGIRRVSLFQIAAFLGVCAFLASSLVSSFSFRMMQNGLVFFFVLAVASKSLLKSKKPKLLNKVKFSPAKVLRFGFAGGIVACSLLLFNCLSRVGSSYYTLQANQTSDIPQVEQLLATASYLDNENPDAHFVYGLRLMREKRYEEAAKQLKQTINLGRGATVDYTYLAMAQNLSGDTSGAEETFAEAVKLYPFSVFAHTRYASLLKTNGKLTQADEQLQNARRINFREANSWWIILNEGVRVASLKSFNNNDFIEVVDMPNGTCLRIIISERELKYGEKLTQIALGK